MMTKILVAVDGSEGSNRALDWAIALANDIGASLLIASVIGGYDLPGDMMRRFSRAETAWFEELLHTTSAEILKKAQDRALKGGATNIRLEARAGDVASTIIEIASENEIETIIVGKRGAGRLEGLLLGSVSQKLASLAPFPVIIVP